MSQEASVDPAPPPSKLAPALGGLNGRVAVVTAGGGAIGAASCVRLAEQGADVVCADWNAGRVGAVGQRVEDLGRRFQPVVADLTTTEGIAALVEAAERLGGADILVNGLGEHLMTAGAFEDSTEEQWQALYEVNLLHVFRACREMVPGMVRRRWGRIVNFSSVEGVRAAPALAVYTAFKRAVDGFTKSLAVDLARHGVLVNAIAVDKTRAHQVGHYELPEEYTRLVETWIPAGRYGEGDDIARIVLFLTSEMNSWVVGQTITADGGTLSAGGWYRTPSRWTNQPLLLQYFEAPEANDGRPPMLR